MDIVGLWRTAVRDLKYAPRTLRRSPGFTIVAVLTLALATAGLAAVAILAGYSPALRASRLDPMAALRYE